MTTNAGSLVCVTTSAAFGGAETSLLTMLTALRTLEPDWRVTVVIPGHGSLSGRCRALGFAVVELPFPSALARLGETAAVGARSAVAARLQFVRQGIGVAAALPGYLTKLRGVFRHAQATVVHTNGLKAHLAAALIKPSSVRLVWHLHDYVRSRPVSMRLLRPLVGRTDAIVANSDSVLSDARAAWGASAPLTRIYNAVDGVRFSPEGPGLPLAERSGLPPDHGLVRIGLVATFARWKGHDVFLDAIARLAGRFPIRAYVIGGAVYETAGSQWSRQELEAMVHRRGLSAIVGLTGHTDDVPAALRSLDIVVHASTEPEPFGMVIAEGMAAQRAVVAACGGGAAELFDDGQTALGYAPGDGEALAGRLAELIQDRARRDRLGSSARHAALDRFSPERMAASFREVYAR
jgi:glycosyltransferase involved in cell wall biosynthesis